MSSAAPGDREQISGCARTNGRYEASTSRDARQNAGRRVKEISAAGVQPVPDGLRRGQRLGSTYLTPDHEWRMAFYSAASASIPKLASWVLSGGAKHTRLRPKALAA